MERGGGEGAVLSVTLRTVAETGSTNADMLELARGGAAEGLWLRADRQTSGRGRQGRAWQSHPGNLHASTLVRLRGGDPQAATLALVAAVAVEEVVSAYLFPGPRRGAAIKWPNDLLIDGAKVAGILLERAGDAVVIGIGVNLAHHPNLPDRRATSLAAHGVAVDPIDFLKTLAPVFVRWLDVWRGEGFAPIRARWLDRAHPIGAPLRMADQDGGTIDGRFDGLDSNGALLLRLADGGVRVIHAADVFLI